VGVRWIGWQQGDGYGDAAAQYMTALEALGVPVTWTPLIWPGGGGRPRVSQHYEGPLAHLAGRAIDHDVVAVHLPANGATEWLAEAVGRRRVLFTTWETDCLPHGWAEHCEKFDAVLVPSTFNRNAYVASGCSTPVSVVPHCARQVAPVEPAVFDRIGDRFVFYTIGTWSTRKAMSETVEAFLDAFDASDDVALVVKTTPFDQQAVARASRGLAPEGPERWGAASWTSFGSLVAGRPNLPEICLIPQQVVPADVDAIHARGDCFFSLTRSEGWGLCISDALLFGNPVVVTGWGGQLDFLGADYPLLVDFDLVPTTSDIQDDWFELREGHRWARARHDDAVDRLRWVAEHRDEAAALGRQVGARVARDFAPEEVGRRLLDALTIA
jgi:glycosyltransferase involved in cell wall biosynthesis